MNISSESSETVNINDLYRFLESNKVILSFLGEFNHDMVTSLLKTIKKSQKLLQKDFGINRKVYAVMVECLENVGQYSVQNRPDIFNKGHKYNSIFLLAQQDKDYIIITGNYITNGDAVKLKKYLEGISLMSIDVLKNNYNNNLLQRSGSINNAGNGLLEIAYKSDKRIEYEIRPIDESVSFYMLQTKVSKS